MAILAKMLGGKPATEPTKATREQRECVVVGAGVSGLVAAKVLAEAGKDVVVVEASEAPGGRVRTDRVKGFLLDRGFQVFLEGYPAVRRHVDYNALELQRFWPGALVRTEGDFHLVADPFRRPQDTSAGAAAPVGTWLDKAKVALMRIGTTGRPIETVMQLPETDTETHLFETLKLTSSIVDRFFRPFYQGIFLAPLKEQSSRMFDMLFHVFSNSDISLPKDGIGAVPQQLASRLPPGCLRLECPVVSVEPGRVTLSDGGCIESEIVVVATEEASAIKLLGERLTGESGAQTVPEGRGTTAFYFAFDGPAPISEPLLILNGEEGADRSDSPINNMVFISNVAPSYAPEGKTLVSVSVVGVPNGRLLALVREQLADWFGKDVVKSWELIKMYRIPYAQPKQNPPNGEQFEKPADLGDGIFVCGDYRGTATLNGAFESGERAAESALAYMKARSIFAEAPKELAAASA